MNLPEMKNAFAIAQSDIRSPAEDPDRKYPLLEDAYKKFLDELNFIAVGEFKRDEEQTVYVHARPDGLILTWETYGDQVGLKNLTFQYGGSLAGLAYEGGTINHGMIITTGSISPGKEGLRSLVEDLGKRGLLLSPYPHPYDADTCFMLERDYTDEDIETDSCPVQAARLAAMPLWVKQMVGVEPLPPAPQPAGPN